MKTPLYCLHPPILFQILSNPTALSVALFLWMSGWLCHIWFVNLLNDTMDLHMSTLGTLVLRDPAVCFMKQSIEFTEVWLIICFFASTLIWYHTSKHKQRHTACSEVNRLTHPYKCILTPPVMCSQQLSVLCCMSKDEDKSSTGKC